MQCQLMNGLVVKMLIFLCSQQYAHQNTAFAGFWYVPPSHLQISGLTVQLHMYKLWNIFSDPALPVYSGAV